MQPNPISYTVDEAAAAVRISRRKLYQAIGSGDLRARKLGQRTIVLAADLHAFLTALPEARTAA